MIKKASRPVRSVHKPAPVAVMILAAGQGKRMVSELPKVLHEIAGQPLLIHVLNAVGAIGDRVSVGIVVGHGKEKVEAAVEKSAISASFSGGISFISQDEQKGTGHAARCAMDSLWGKRVKDQGATVLVLPGDLPLIPSALIEALAAPFEARTVLRLLTCDFENPLGYGRVLRQGKNVLRIVEERDATPLEKRIREVAASIYAFDAKFLAESLPKLTTSNAQGEYYLTDLVARASKVRSGIEILKWSSAEDLRGVNNRYELAEAGGILNRRLIKRWAEAGVTFRDPSSTWLDTTVTFEADVSVGPGVVLLGKTTVGKGSTLGPHVVLKDVEVGEGANIKTGTVAEASKIGRGVQLGPYAHLRPDSVVGEGSKIGNFVELKKTKIGSHTNVSHLSYLGDAEVGSHVNIGCGFITCNFDGRVIEGLRKHRTLIEDDVFMGSDCQTVAPIRIGKGAYVASGSTITQNVEPEALAIARSRQVNKLGYARRIKQKE
ncbi:bifunctional UDP-N-acetylglucosamine diphosphorylase/glucosamine-1-phosphate N-acetyltransferase GlmU [Bdellovibrionota bacterium FG-2]